MDDHLNSCESDGVVGRVRRVARYAPHSLSNLRRAVTRHPPAIGGLRGPPSEEEAVLRLSGGPLTRPTLLGRSQRPAGMLDQRRAFKSGNDRIEFLGHRG